MGRVERASNTNDGAYGKVELKDKQARVFGTAAASLCVGAVRTAVAAFDQWFVGRRRLVFGGQVESDCSCAVGGSPISCLSTLWLAGGSKRMSRLETYHRPMICTEYMARGAGSTFDTILPSPKSTTVGAINWGLVVGKRKRIYPGTRGSGRTSRASRQIWFSRSFFTRMETVVVEEGSESIGNSRAVAAHTSNISKRCDAPVDQQEVKPYQNE